MLSTVATRPNGGFRRTVAMPSSATPGQHVISAAGESSGSSASVDSTVRTDWVGFQFDLGNTGANPYENVLSASNVSGLEEVWSAFTGTTESQPAIVGGIAYMASWSSLTAVDMGTGAVLWAQGVDSVGSSPSVSNGVVYLGTGDGLDAFEAATGAMMWTTGTGAARFSSPAVADGKVFAGNIYGSLWAFDAATGQKLWRASVGGLESEMSAIVANGVVYTGTVDGFDAGKLVALDSTTGQVLAERELGGEVFGTPSVAHVVVLVGEANGFTYAFSLSMTSHH